MAERLSTDAPRLVTSIWPAVLWLAVAIGMLAWSRTYGETAARFPSLVAGAMVALAVIDIWSRTDLPGRAAVQAFWGTGFARREMSHNPTFGEQLRLILWVAGGFAGMAVFGILVAAPVFCALYVWLHGRHSLLAAGYVGLGVVAFQYAIFEWLLDYELYRGVLLTKGGFAAW
jgi:hypothetical protein